MITLAEEQSGGACRPCAGRKLCPSVSAFQVAQPGIRDIFLHGRSTPLSTGLHNCPICCLSHDMPLCALYHSPSIRLLHPFDLVSSSTLQNLTTTPLPTTQSQNTTHQNTSNQPQSHQTSLILLRRHQPQVFASGEPRARISLSITRCLANHPYSVLDRSTHATMFSCSNQPRGCRGRCDTAGGKCAECRVGSHHAHSPRSNPS